jgi:hypothetical protein
LEDSASKRSWSKSGDAFYQGRQPSNSRETSLPENTNWENGAAITDNQPTSGDDRAAKEWEPPRVVVDPKGQRANSRRELCGEECGQGRALSCEPNDAGEDMGNAEVFNGAGQAGGKRETQAGGTGAAQYEREIKSALGRDIARSANRLDNAKLYVTCDNRTDELRLLGNGVVPDCAALAFTTLLNEQRNTRHLA